MKINQSKLILHNLTSPYHKRVSAAALQARVDAARHRGNMVGLHAQIRAEVEEEIKNAKSWENLFN